MIKCTYTSHSHVKSLTPSHSFCAFVTPFFPLTPGIVFINLMKVDRWRGSVAEEWRPTFCFWYIILILNCVNGDQWHGVCDGRHWVAWHWKLRIWRSGNKNNVTRANFTNHTRYGVRRYRMFNEAGQCSFASAACAAMNRTWRDKVRCYRYFWWQRRKKLL